VSMREFLRSGKFGPVRLGDTIDSVRSIFGDPSDVCCPSGRRRIPRIWRYGDVEFHLSDDAKRVWLIFCDTFDRLRIGTAASFDRWFFEGHPSIEAVERELSTAGLTFSRHDAPHAPTTILLRLDSCVELLFGRGDDPVSWPGVPGLFGFQYADHRVA
jgi:hypothetical protein